MALDESHRRELFDALDSAIGPRPAATLMAHLPPVGWADVATKHDLHELERRLDLRFEAIDHRFEGSAHRTDAAINRLAAELRAEMVAQTRALFLGVAAMTFTVAGLSFVAARAGG